MATGARRIYVETPSRDRFEAEIACGTPLNQVAADFFDSQGWPAKDQQGRGQRAVVELVNPHDPDDTKRLNGDLDICEALQDGDTLRIFPESIAGAVDQRDRTAALVMDHAEVKRLCEREPRISFETNRVYAPDLYTVTFRFPSFVELPAGRDEPLRGEAHRAEIVLDAEYPGRAPLVRWLTPIFHPNIRPADGAVCLGVLRERYLPGLGLARLVNMLAEMVQWRNFDAFNPFNRTAAEWAVNAEHWGQIEAIGGHPFQGPIAQLFERLQQEGRPRIEFRRPGAR